LLVAAIDCLRNIPHRGNPETTGFGEQRLFFGAKSESAKPGGYALASAPRMVLYLTALIDRIVLGFNGAAQPRLHDAENDLGADISFTREFSCSLFFWNMQVIEFSVRVGGETGTVQDFFIPNL